MPIISYGIDLDSDKLRVFQNSKQAYRDSSQNRQFGQMMTLDNVTRIVMKDVTKAIKGASKGSDIRGVEIVRDAEDIGVLLSLEVTYGREQPIIPDEIRSKLNLDNHVIYPG